MSIIEIFLVISVITIVILQIIIALNVRKSQSSDSTPLLMNLAKTINDKFDTSADKQKDYNYEVKDILTNQSTESREKIFGSLRTMQNEVSTTIQNALIGLQKSNTIELEKIANQSKNSFDAIYDSNAKKLIEIQNEIEKRMNENLANNLRSFQEVSLKLGEMSKTAQVMIESTSSIDKLNRIFDRTASKSFGGFAEKYLETTLDCHLKGLWQSQVMVKNGQEAIDFVITLNDITVGIDSKFPLTTFSDYEEATKEQKAEKLKVYLAKIRDMATDIADKYGSQFTHLYLYIPSDAMYNEVASNQQLMDKIHKLKINIISPVTLLTVIYAITHMKDKIALNDSAYKMQEYLGFVDKALGKFQEEYDKLGKKLDEAKKSYDNSTFQVNKISSQITKVRNLDLKHPEENLYLELESGTRELKPTEVYIPDLATNPF
jgi:DNA anti-recombination protein RmuC